MKVPRVAEYEHLKVDDLVPLFQESSKCYQMFTQMWITHGEITINTRILAKHIRT